MNVNYKALSVSIENVEFAKDFHYFLTLRIDSSAQKHRTDVSELVNNPVFATNSFSLPLKSTGGTLDLYQRLHFGAFVVTDRPENLDTELEAKGQAKLLGECAIDLDSIITQLTDNTGIGVKQVLKFTREQGSKIVTVGRFLANLKIIGDYDLGGEGEILASGGLIAAKDITHELPPIGFGYSKWRMRIDVRCCVNCPQNRETAEGLPSMFMQIGWSKYRQNQPDDDTMMHTLVVEGNRHPVFNQQIMYNAPPEAGELSGYFWIILRDKYVSQPTEKIVFPANFLVPFKPAHIEFLRFSGEFEQRCQIFMSFTLEQPLQSFADKLCLIGVKWVDFDPLPKGTNRCFISYTTAGYKPTELPFVQCDLRDEMGIARAFESAHKQYAIYMSPILKIPPEKAESEDGSIVHFLIPKSYLENKSTIYIFGKDETQALQHPMPNTLLGFTNILDEDLRYIYYSEKHEQMIFPVKYYGNTLLYDELSQSKCVLECVAYPIDEGIERPQSHPGLAAGSGYGAPSPMGGMGGMGMQGGLAGLEGVSDKEKWKVLSKELGQKQELINRMMKEVDDKTQSLKLTGAEIMDLRRTVKMLQSENAILRKQIGEEESISMNKMVSEEIAKMGIEELRHKILKLAHGYRTERLRNEEFEKALKAAQIDIQHSKKLKMEFETLQNAHQQKAKKLLDMQREVQKVNLYKDTIRKQEKVINKLETLLNKTVRDTKSAREDVLELEKLKTENLGLQKEIRQGMRSQIGTGHDDLDRYREEISSLENQVAKLERELNSKRPYSSKGEDGDWVMEKIEFEVRQKKSETRIQALEGELENNARRTAHEIARLKAIVTEKESIIESMGTMDPGLNSFEDEPYKGGSKYGGASNGGVGSRYGGGSKYGGASKGGSKLGDYDF